MPLISAGPWAKIIGKTKKSAFCLSLFCAIVIRTKSRGTKVRELDADIIVFSPRDKRYVTGC